MKREGKLRKCKKDPVYPLFWEKWNLSILKKWKEKEKIMKMILDEYIWKLEKEKGGSQHIMGKLINGQLVRTKECDGMNGREVLWAPHFMRIIVTYTKWTYLCNHPHFQKLKRPF